MKKKRDVNGKLWKFCCGNKEEEDISPNRTEE
jgi:hypothetical protein